MLTLVTGSNGHVGNALTRRLLADGRRLRLLVRTTSNLDSLKKADGSLLDGVELVYGDVLDPESLAKAVEGCERVFHVAGVFKTRGADETLMMRTNTEGGLNMLRACAKAGVKRVVYTSSVAAVGCRRTPTEMMTEADWNSKPIDAYVASKAEGERQALGLAKELGLDVVFVNPATVLGPWDWGPTPSNDFILLYMKKAPPVWFASGHSYVDVDDVAEGHVLAEAKGQSLQRYILSGENISNLDLFKRLAALTGGRAPFIKVGHGFVEIVGRALALKSMLDGKSPLFTRAKAHQLIDYYGYFDCSKARKELGYEFRHLDKVFERAQGWY